MIVHAFEIDTSLQLVPIDPQQAVTASQNSDARVWIDLHDPDTSELNPWLEKLSLTAMSKRLLRDARHHTGFYPLNHETLLVIPFLHIGKTGLREARHLFVLCRDNLLLTIHEASLLTPQRSIEIRKSGEWLADRSISALLSALMIELSLDCLANMAAIRSLIVVLEEKMDREPDLVDADEIVDMRTELRVLDTVVSEQLPSLESLRTIEESFFANKDSALHMHCALANLQAADRSIDRLDRRIGDLRAGFQMFAQDKTNHRLGLLTILSAIFMPITLLAGIWGMNFQDMPELDSPMGYPLAIGMMVMIPALMLYYFYRNGWFE
ncbi:hypothetical protein NHH03_02570 [Stieleria sp. TO1_6]|uniref:magnesium transporter CorA family protein n=1 Tax=Stieleria tagensis TaxID=2956795 RepID=UPI00209B62A3|nr:CorA family divalent cation transporter [Stieleria tagensis]MCO8120607.1 hypothetical protein [Stieleria tagensis]